jgi:hypothetical protein
VSNVVASDARLGLRCRLEAQVVGDLARGGAHEQGVQRAALPGVEPGQDFVLN